MKATSISMDDSDKELAPKDGSHAHSDLASTFQPRRLNGINLEYWIKQRSQGREAWMEKNQRQGITSRIDIFWLGQK